MERCAHCGASAEKHPFIGVDGDGKLHPVCALCQGDSARRQNVGPALKLHYMPRPPILEPAALLAGFKAADLPGWSGAAGVMQGPPMAGDPNTTRVEASLYYTTKELLVSEVEVNFMEALRKAFSNVPAAESARGFYSRVREAARVHIVVVMPGVHSTETIQTALTGMTSSADGALDHIDVQTWAIHR